MAVATSKNKGFFSILLGYIDEKITEKYAKTLDFSTCKIGGTPNWMSNKVPSSADLRCSVCDSFLILVTQIYAPLDRSPYHRTLYLFACLRRDCWNSNKSWKCFRSQELDTSSLNETTMSNVQSCQVTDWVEDADDWGEDDNEEHNDSNDDENGNIVVESTIDLMNTLSCKDDEDGSSTSDLSSSNDLNANEVATKNVSIGGAIGGDNCQAIATAEIEEDIEGEVDVVVLDSPSEEIVQTTQIPSLFFQTDNADSTLSYRRQSQYPAIFTPYFLGVEEELHQTAIDTSISDHERKLLVDYRCREDSERADGFHDDGYEKAVPRHGDITFHKFLSVIRKNPGQVLRYSRESVPLLISKSSSSEFPNRCTHCNGPMVFEFQLLSSLVYFLRSDRGGEIEFGTVLIFTCKNSCYTSDSTVKLEQVMVQAEPL